MPRAQVKQGFGVALNGIKFGERWMRDGWNGKGMFVRLAEEHLDGTAQHLILHPVSGPDVPWTASQTDLLAEDWIRYEDPEPKRLYSRYPLSQQALRGTTEDYERIFVRALDRVLHEYFGMKGDPERFKIEVRREANAWSLDTIELRLEGWSKP